MATDTDLSVYDLTPKICKYFDAHMTLPIMEFLSKKTLYSPDVVTRTKLRILSQSKMVDYVIQIHQELEGAEIPPDLLESQSRVREEYRVADHKKDIILSIYQATEARKMETGQELDDLFDQLCRKEEMTAASMIKDLYQFAKLNYECGDYGSALDTLTWFFTLASSNYDQEMMNSANWGRLACQILLQKFDDALNSLDQLRESIDRGSESVIVKQNKRTWWVHWSLFVFFHHENGLDRLAQIIAGSEQDLREDRVLLSTIQNQCPYLFRYFAVAALLSSRGDMVKRLLQFITENRVVSDDPIVEFLIALYKDFDFTLASQKLATCFEVVQNDFFLTGCYQLFIEAARRAVLQNFITIYQCISLKMLGECMHLSEAQAEQWIVKYIQEKNLIAKINAKEAHVIIRKDPPPIHQQMLDKTQELKQRSSLLHQKVRQKYEENQKKGRGGAKHNVY